MPRRMLFTLLIVIAVAMGTGLAQANEESTLKGFERKTELTTERLTGLSWSLAL